MSIPKVNPKLIARRRILDEANRKRLALSEGILRPYSARHICQAVCTVRHYHLVDNGTLVAAGFRGAA
jgi:hypothetical protein